MRGLIKSAIDKVDALRFLESHPVGTLASINDKHVSELSTIYFIPQSDLSCTIVTKTFTRKYKNFLRRPKATLLVFDEKELASIEIQGEIQTESDALKAAQYIEQFQELVVSRQDAETLPPVSQIEAGDYVVCTLVPGTVYFNRFTSAGRSRRPERVVFDL